jgi:hypothetical protein
MPASRTLRKGEFIGTATYTALTADAMLTFTNTNAINNQAIDLGEFDIDSIVIENDLTVLTGSSTPTVRIVAVTSNAPILTVAGSAGVLQGDGSTAFATANQTAVGDVMRGLSKQASTGASASNLGKYLGVYFDVVSGTVTDATGTVRVYVKGK